MRILILLKLVGNINIYLYAMDVHIWFLRNFDYLENFTPINCSNNAFPEDLWLSITGFTDRENTENP